MSPALHIRRSHFCAKYGNIIWRIPNEQSPTGSNDPIRKKNDLKRSEGFIRKKVVETLGIVPMVSPSPRSLNENHPLWHPHVTCHTFTAHACFLMCLGFRC